ncbi:hypothetical protein [Streptococcus sp. 2018162]|uniref:hypothetical protein n=1 Tax=Streptococcus sp. 2018162 TaxID=2870783 RepID=UPI001C8D0298|nr:hypothetical protein [Streptococcus sp. 2018162]MBY0730788.1 hypothetical protein [Streptococcus sp. 2018162]
MGCDISKPLWWISSVYFNPRTRMGCDVTFIRKNTNRYLCISIHAPVWGATQSGLLSNQT